MKTIYNKLWETENVKINDESSDTSPTARQPSGLTIFTVEEKTRLCNNIIAMAEYGFPRNMLDVVLIVKQYLTRSGRTVQKFRDNLPGRDWLCGFFKRHPQLSICVTTNISASRAAITEETINKYINKLKVTLDCIPPDRIYNYDESNLSNDPGSTKKVVKRDCKYPELILHSSKACTSLMVCVMLQVKSWHYMLFIRPENCGIPGVQDVRKERNIIAQ